MPWVLGITSVALVWLLLSVIARGKRDAMHFSLLLLVAGVWLTVLVVWLGLASLSFRPDRLMETSSERGSQ